MDLAHSRVSPHVKATGASNTTPAVINSLVAFGCLRAVDMGRSVTWPEALGTSAAVTVELLVAGAVDVGSPVTWPEALGTSAAVTVELLVAGAVDVGSPLT